MSVSFDVTVEVLWEAWLAFRRGKARSAAIEEFAYYLESNLLDLLADLLGGSYTHGTYKRFVVTDSKRREISVAAVRDRVVHRLLYDYLTRVFDHRFSYDAWSCRKDKGLTAAIKRVQEFARGFPRAYFWRMDIKKFFDSIHQPALIRFLGRPGMDERALGVCKLIIRSYATEPERGMPIGNLTSQIFANVYLNELDRYSAYCIRPLRYARYGDDAIFVFPSLDAAKTGRELAKNFIEKELSLTINPKSDIVKPVRWGIKYLGVWIYPSGKGLMNSVRSRIDERLEWANVSSYSGLVSQNEPERIRALFDWKLYEKIIRRS